MPSERQRRALMLERSPFPAPHPVLLPSGEKEPKPAAVLHKAALCPYVVTSGGNHAPTEQGIVLGSYFSLDFCSLLPFHNFCVARGFTPERSPDVVDARFERRH